MEYRKCAIDCVGEAVLKQYQQQYNACNKDFDLLFSVDTGDTDFYRKVIEMGHIYETGYQRCICWKKDEDPNRCECSRQALIYLYSQLLPDKKVTVETIQTVHNGAENCVFRIVVD